jgi:hypothetical protein
MKYIQIMLKHNNKIELNYINYTLLLFQSLFLLVFKKREEKVICSLQLAINKLYLLISYNYKSGHSKALTTIYSCWTSTAVLFSFNNSLVQLLAFFLKQMIHRIKAEKPTTIISSLD